MSLDVALYVEIDAGGAAPEDVCLYDANITHNLAPMAHEAGIYEALWRPEEVGAVRAGDIIEKVEAGLALMRGDPARFEALNALNNWGTYEQFVPWVAEYLAACQRYPKAVIRVSR